METSGAQQLRRLGHALGNFLVEWKRELRSVDSSWHLCLGNFLVEWKLPKVELADDACDALETS